MNKHYINQVVEHIRSVGVWFDAADVEEDVESVLWQCGFGDGFPDEDLAMLKSELLPLGLKHELAEVARVVAQEAACPEWMPHGQPALDGW